MVEKIQSNREFFIYLFCYMCLAIYAYVGYPRKKNKKGGTSE